MARMVRKNMKIHNVYTWKFEELSPEQQEKAIQENWDINVFYDWWDMTYEDAEMVDLKITGFDIGRGNDCEIEFEYTPLDTAEAIIKNHGKSTDTYKTAKNYITERESILRKAPKDEHGDPDEWEVEDELEEAEDEFRRDLSSDYLQMLREGYEYLTSEEAIKETLIANDYDFTENGKIY